MRNKRILCLAISVLLLLLIFAGCTKQQEAPQASETIKEVSSLSDLENKKIGVVTGTMTAVLVPMDWKI